MSEWIPVSERLPDDDRPVLVCVNGHPYIAWYSADVRSWCTEDFVLREPSAWMPLPQPHSKEGQ